MRCRGTKMQQRIPHLVYKWMEKSVMVEVIGSNCRFSETLSQTLISFQVEIFVLNVCAQENLKKL